MAAVPNATEHEPQNHPGDEPYSAGDQVELSIVDLGVSRQEGVWAREADGN